MRRKMRKLNDCQSSELLKKYKEKSKKHKSMFKLSMKNCWPKVMISRDDFLYKNTKNILESTDAPFLEETSSELQLKEENIEHLCCDDNGANFKEEHDVCLISSSSEIQDSFRSKTCADAGESLEKLSEESDFHSTKSINSENQEKPIFVDLTADEKNTWKQTILKRFCNLNENMDVMEDRNEESSANLLEPRIMIADSSSKLNYGIENSTTALRNRGPCLIPIQPNRSLPILPAPSVPTRAFRKSFSPLLSLSKSSALDIVEVESLKLIDSTLSTQNIHKERDDVNSEKQITLNESINYVVSNVETLEKNDNDLETDVRKKKKSEEADSSENKVERAESSIKDFLTNFCGSNATDGMQHLCADKCVRVISTTKEEHRNKLVPPLRLKIVRANASETEPHNNSETISGSERKSNYRIIKDTTPQPSSNSNYDNWTDVFYEKDTDHSSSNADSYKLKYRRNRLKQKLRELRNKALELSKQMTNNPCSEQSTRLRQAMNRYEKQIENLSKLHSKLSTAVPAFSEVININDDGEKCTFMNLNETSSSANNNSVGSPEPPKLSPRSPLNYDDVTTEEVRSSPPILPRICFAASSSQDSREELKSTDIKVWSTVDLMTSTLPVDSVRNRFIDDAASNMLLESQNSTEDKCLHRSENATEFSESNVTAREQKEEGNKLMEEISEGHLILQQAEQIKDLKFYDATPIIKSVTSTAGMPMTEEGEMFENAIDKQFSSRESNSQTNSCKADRINIPFSNISEDYNIQKVSSSTTQSNQFDVLESTSSQNHITLRENYKSQEESSDLTHSDSNSITEQFPSLGNWLARMSKKQTPKIKSKLKSNAPFVPMENSTQIKIPGSEVPIVEPNTTNDITNTTPQCNTDKWQYHQQQQRQQLLQHVTASMTLAQPVATVPSLRPSTYPTVPITPFYMNNYSIDPYNSAVLSYHPPLFPYGTYPYHSRLHSSSIPGYHFSMQESLRPVQQIDKRFSQIQDPMVRYPATSTNTLQHPSNLEYRNLENATTSSVGNRNCLPSLFMPPTSLPSSHQTLSRTTPIDRPTNNQFSRDRMIPDVVAAAAAAAVVAAASFDRQRDTLNYKKSDADMLLTPGIGNIIDEESPHTLSVNKSINNNCKEESHENTKYQQIRSILFDRLTSVKTADSFASSIIPSTAYQVPLNSSVTQVSTNLLGNEGRNSETPNLGKVNRNPNGLHSLACSNCGIIGPKFKCLGCETAFYCDQRCQEKHWYIHVQVCPKKMPKLKKVI